MMTAWKLFEVKNPLSFFMWGDRYTRGLIKLGVPPSEFKAREKYDAAMDRLLDMAVYNSIQDCRRKARKTLWYRINKYFGLKW